ncbi:hypothetical protein [Pinibacter soli]|uniref:Tail fiber protein n=1 Tax=Pinibacter soli TaxID=3044211 RepID=A0ABT6R9L4_9BACT|nr:hypothetical protein [Pinibacter soli]MDI3319116.1 hypothetical protein [Pinibacter soli]
MAKQTIEKLKGWFKTGLKPTQQQFWDWLDSFWHKDDKIPVGSIDGLQKALDNMPDAGVIKGLGDQFQKHVSDTENPHEVTKDQVGLGSVNNTSDEDKPISNATAAALQFVNNAVSTVDAKADTKLTQGGDALGENLVAGTNDNYPFIVKQNGIERERLAATTGNKLIGTAYDNGIDKLQVNGSINANSATLHSEGLGNSQVSNVNINRTEDGATFGLNIGTGKTYGLRYLLFQSYGTSFPALFYFPSTTFVGSLSVSGIFNCPTIETSSPEGWSFISGLGTTRRDISKPILKIGNTGHVKIATNPATSSVDNYAAALDVQSTTAGFLPPRMTTAQRDSLDGIFEYTVTNGGSGYVSPVITVSGGGGSGAIALDIEIVNGTITRIFASSSGSGYTSQPTITITDSGGGSGATAIAKLGKLEGGLTIYNLDTRTMQTWNGTMWKDHF